jgi:hypothetical protein
MSDEPAVSSPIRSRSLLTPSSGFVRPGNERIGLAPQGSLFEQALGAEIAFREAPYAG